MSDVNSDLPRKRGLRWWPAVMILILAGAVLLWLLCQPELSFQARNIRTVSVAAGTFLLLLIWWLTASRASWRLRLGTAVVIAAAIGLGLAMVRVRGVSGDVLPILELRWVRPVQLPSTNQAQAGNIVPPAAFSPALDFPQFLGPDRTAILTAPALRRDWQINPPRILWRQPVGAAWSGWAIVGARAFTQEQRGEEECTTCYEALTGRLLWSHADPAHYNTTLGGEGPRCTPTVVSNRVFTLGATGILNCLDLATGRRIWSHHIVEDARSRVPQWGFAGSPLVYDGLVVVGAGGSADRSLLAYRTETGELAWSGGSQPVSYGSPFLATLAGRRQILAFNSRKITAHDAASGQVLWEYPFGIGEPLVAVPVVLDTNRVLFSAAYGVGSELLEVRADAAGRLSPVRVWQTRKMKAKFANLVQREGFLYGLDDGVFACIDLKDGSPAWRGGHYGHGQGLLVRDLLLQMAENGELILLQPTPTAPNELHRFRVFPDKTWNPIAISGNLLLARTDREAAALLLPVEPAR